MSVPEVIGILLGVFAVISVAGKWLLSDWHKKKIIIQELEAKNMQAMFDKIDKDLNGLGNKSRTLEKYIKDHATSITKVTAKLEVMANILNSSLNVSKAINLGTVSAKRVDQTVDKMKDSVQKVQEDLKDMKDD